jgi:hypothetical protein
MTKHVTTVNPVQNTTYDLINNPIDFGTGTDINVSSGSGIGVYGSSAQSWSVTNEGAISGSSIGVDLTAGGSVANEAGATISGYRGVEISGGVGTVTNAGTIIGAGYFGYGVFFRPGSPGSVTNEAGGTISASYGVFLLNGGTVTNAGKISAGRRGVAIYGGVGSVINEAGGTISANNPVFGDGVNCDTVTNEAGATISAYGQRGAVGVSANPGPAAIENYGNIVSNGNGVGTFYGGVVNNAKGGTISGANDVGSYDGGVLFLVGVGGRAGVVTNAGAISGKVGVFMGTYYVGTPETVTNAGTISGTIASVEFAGPGANTLTLETGSTLNGDAIGSTSSGATNALILEGHGTANNNFDNFNTLNVQANGNWRLGGSSTFGATTVSSGTLIVAGALTGGATTLGDPAGDLAQIAIASTGTWDIADDSGIGLGSNASSSISNSGVFEKTGTGTSAIAPQLVNNGSVVASSGTLDLQGGISGNGTDTISGASNLEFDSTVGGGQTTGFMGGGTLDLIDPQGFAARIAGFAATDKVDLAGYWVLSNFSETGSGNMGTLTLTSGSSQLSLKFLGDYMASDFNIASGPTTTTITHTL